MTEKTLTAQQCMAGKRSLPVRAGFTSLIAISLFAVLSFVLKDFNLHVFAGYALFGLIGIYFMIRNHATILLTKTKTAAGIFALVVTVLAVLPNALISVSTLSIVLAIDVSMLYIIVSKPARQDVRGAIRILLIASALMSTYAVLVSLFPPVYFSFVKKVLPSNTQTFIETAIRLKYGVSVGGEVVAVDYYAFFGLVISLNALLILRRRLKYKLLYIGIIAVCALCIVLQNRKAELVMSVLVVTILFLSDANVVSIHGKWKRILVFLLVAGIALAGFLFMMSQGYLARYESFFTLLAKKSATNSSVIDVTSGRMKLWSRAINLFKEHPVFGIGWGKFRLYLTDTYNYLNEGQLSNVHNNYLQLLCETGIVGLILYTGPLFYMLYRTVKRIRRLRRAHINDSLVRVAASTSLAVQLFYLAISFIDPVWYKMFTWPFFGVAIIFLVYAEREKAVSGAREVSADGGH